VAITWRSQPPQGNNFRDRYTSASEGKTKEELDNGYEKMWEQY
jgi:hypothetical protein